MINTLEELGEHTRRVAESLPSFGEARTVATVFLPRRVAGTGVRLITVDGGGHTWFANAFGPLRRAVDATQEVWS